MTNQITHPELMTDGQRKQIRRFLRRFLEDGISAIDLETFNFSKEEAQEIIEKGDLLQNGFKEFVIGKLKKLAVIDQRFGPALVEFDLTVPMDYDDDKQIDQFGKKTKKLKTTYHYNDALKSSNYENATNKLEPGKTYLVKIFPVLETVSSEDCMNFLKKQRAILVGGQGLTLAQDLKADEFPVEKWTVSFDEKDTLWSDSVGDHRVPDVYRGSGGGWGFGLGYFSGPWGSGDCILCFCDK
ncbi:MAG: hypothetical protein ACOYMZ_01070 [Minisyncoccia bacterium]